MDKIKLIYDECLELILKAESQLTEAKNNFEEYDNVDAIFGGRVEEGY